VSSTWRMGQQSQSLFAAYSTPRYSLALARLTSAAVTTATVAAAACLVNGDLLNTHQTGVSTTFDAVREVKECARSSLSSDRRVV